MESAHARFMATRLRILQVNDSDTEASAVVKTEGQNRVSALSRDVAGNEDGFMSAAHERGMKLAGILIVGLV
jgi:hypothetical protein